MKYAIVVSGGKQYKVSEGEEIKIDKLKAIKGDKYPFQQILLIRSDDDIAIGTPYVTKGEVMGKIIGEEKGEKITISKFKAKVHYRRKMGFRPLYTKVKIESISLKSSARSVKPG